MPVELKDHLHRAYPAAAAPAHAPGEVWRRGRRARRRRQVAAAVGVAAAVAAVFAGLLQVARPGGVAIIDDPVGPAPAAESSWDVLPPGEFGYDQIDAEIDGWETVLQLEGTDTAAFDVTPDGTVAVFVPTAGRITVRTAGRPLREIDASFLSDAFDPERSFHRLRIGPDDRFYLTSLAPDAVRDQHRLTVFEPSGVLVGSKVTPTSHEPVAFGGGLVWLRTDDGWAAVATLGGDLSVGATRITSPEVPEVTWIDDQGSILNQITGGPMVGTRYTLRQDDQQLSWTGPMEGVTGWASGPPHEDRPAVVLVQHDDRPPLVLAPSLSGLLAGWAPPDAAGLAGVGSSHARIVDTPEGTWLYWLEPDGDRLALVRAAPR